MFKERDFWNWEKSDLVNGPKKKLKLKETVHFVKDLFTKSFFLCNKRFNNNEENWKVSKILTLLVIS